MVSSGPNGSAQLFKIAPRDLSIQGKGIEQIHECNFGSQLNELPISPPKQMIRSARVNYATFEPCAVSHGGEANIRRIAGIQGSSLYLYDIPSARLIGSEQVSDFNRS